MFQMEEEEEEEEAVTNHCSRLISVVRSKRQHLESLEEERRRRQKGARGRERSECERRATAGDELRDHGECTERGTDQTPSSLTRQGPQVQPVPPQLISMLRLKTFKEEMRRAAEVELHDPAVCSVCEQEQASLALTSFIRRKKTQLQFQRLKGRLNTHFSYGSVQVGGVCAQSPKALQCPLLDLAGTALWTRAGHSNLGLPWQRLRNVELPWQQMK